MQMSAETERSRFVGSLAKACRVLALFDVESPEWTLSGMVAHTGMTKTTVFRIAKTLEGCGALVFNPGTAAYRLGPLMIPLGYLVVSDVYVVRIARPRLERLAEDTGETVELLIEGQNGSVVADQVNTSHPFKANLPIGRILQGFGSSSFKLFLSFKSEKQIRAALALPPVEMSPRAVTDPDLLAAEIQRIAKERIAFSIEGRTIGVCSVSAPVVDALGAVKAAVTLVAPTERFSVARRKRLAAAVKETADLISRELGAR
jgi:IclR family transcriptional regulator, KDG regulon repressor